MSSLPNPGLRVLLNTRRCLLGKRLDIERQIRGNLKVFGLKVGAVATSRFDLRIRELVESDPQLWLSIGPLLEARRHMLEQFRKLDGEVQKVVKNDPVCRSLTIAPGVGALTALAFKTSIDRPERFVRSRDVGVALGMTPRRYASGATGYDGRITKCGDAMARNHLYAASMVLLTCVKRRSALKTGVFRLRDVAQ